MLQNLKLFEHHVRDHEVLDFGGLGIFGLGLLNLYTDTMKYYLVVKCSKY
jgi:hypothetical protein